MLIEYVIQQSVRSARFTARTFSIACCKFLAKAANSVSWMHTKSKLFSLCQKGNPMYDRIFAIPG